MKMPTQRCSPSSVKLRSFKSVCASFRVWQNELTAVQTKLRTWKIVCYLLSAVKVVPARLRAISTIGSGDFPENNAMHQKVESPSLYMIRSSQTNYTDWKRFTSRKNWNGKSTYFSWEGWKWMWVLHNLNQPSKHQWLCLATWTMKLWETDQGANLRSGYLQTWLAGQIGWATLE